MKNNYYILALTFFMLVTSCAQTEDQGFRGFEFMEGEVVDPLVHHAYLYRLDQGDKFKCIRVDINNDGTKDYLLVDLGSYTEDQQLEFPSTWNLYLSQPSGKYLCVKDASGVRVLPSLFYVGSIDELGDKKGIVTIQTESPREGEPVSHIYATTIEADGTLKEEKLTTFPAEQENVIFDKYLTEEKRCKEVVDEKQAQ